MWDTIVAEFTDIRDIGDWTRIFVRFVVAGVLGGAIGFEREHRGKQAGMRTHMLVALGSALFILVPLQSGASMPDVTRVIQGLITGVGFLGGGVIWTAKAKGTTHGLTTAAGLWLTAAIGMTVGSGKLLIAIICTALALGVLALLPKLPPEQHNGVLPAQ